MLLSRLLLLISIVLAFLTLKGHSRKGGYLKFQFLCYQNPGHLDIEGYLCDSIATKSCDPFFFICISNKPINDVLLSSCPVYHMKTDPYYDHESVCNTPSDNRGSLGTIPTIELPYPLQEVYYIRIVVQDANRYSADGNIAVFSTKYQARPSQNNKTFINTEITMRRSEKRLRNPKAKLKIAIGLKCDSNLYGDFCETFCSAIPSYNYICSTTGEKICKSGWEGKDCHTRDLCHYTLCAKGAVCIKIRDQAKCLCKGIIGPQCYPNYNPCSPNPCQNNGECVQDSSLSGGISCVCKPHYHGYRCDQEFNLCKVDPCRNNGTCVHLLNGTRQCICQPDYKGVLCDYPADTMNNTANGTIPIAGYRIHVFNFGLIFGVLFGMCLFIMTMVGIGFFVNSKKDKVKFAKNGNDIKMKNLSHGVPSQRQTSPEYGSCGDDTQYDTIDDRSKYVYIQNENDDYLVPSKPCTPAISPNNMSDSSDYIPMFNNDNLYSPDPITSENTAENEELPPLPTRNPKKEKFKLFRIFQK